MEGVRRKLGVMEEADEVFVRGKYGIIHIALKADGGLVLIRRQCKLGEAPVKTVDLNVLLEVDPESLCQFCFRNSRW